MRPCVSVFRWLCALAAFVCVCCRVVLASLASLCLSLLACLWPLVAVLAVRVWLAVAVGCLAFGCLPLLSVACCGLLGACLLSLVCCSSGLLGWRGLLLCVVACLLACWCLLFCSLLSLRSLCSALPALLSLSFSLSLACCGTAVSSLWGGCSAASFGHRVSMAVVLLCAVQLYASGSWLWEPTGGTGCRPQSAVATAWL